MEQIRNFINQLNPQYVSIAVFVVLIITTVLTAMWINGLTKSKQLKENYEKLKQGTKENVTNAMVNSKFKAFNYEAIEIYMSRVGIDYMTNGKLNPLTYSICKVFFALLSMIVGIKEGGVIVGIIALILGYFALDIIMNISDSADNDNMLEDIKGVYDTLRIQTKAGVYITSVLTDCYLVVQNKRLKKAFLELTSDIIAKNDTDESLDKFKNKFRNPYIDTLVIIVKQSMKTGQASKMFDDIKIQIIDIEQAMLQAEQMQIKAQITFVQVLLYIAIIVVSIYIAMISLSAGLSF